MGRVEIVRLNEELGKLNQKIDALPLPKPAKSEKVILSTDGLEKLSPEALSSVKFKLSLNEMQWAVTEDGDGVTDTLLIEK